MRELVTSSLQRDHGSKYRTVDDPFLKKRLSPLVSPTLAGDTGVERLVSTMTLVKHDSPKTQLPIRHFDVLDRFFDDWPSFIRRPVMLFSDNIIEPMRVEQFTEDHTLVVRAEVPGVDPDKDVRVSIVDDMLHIEVERREEEKSQDRGYTLRELRYGSFSRDITLPRGVKESDVVADYRDGILEVRVSMPKSEEHEPKKIPISTH